MLVLVTDVHLVSFPSSFLGGGFVRLGGYCFLFFWWIYFVGVILFWFVWVFLSLEVGAGGRVVLVITGVFEFLVVVGGYGLCIYVGCVDMGVLLILLVLLFCCRYTFPFLLVLVCCVGVRVERVGVGRWGFLGLVGWSLGLVFLLQLFLLCL